MYSNILPQVIPQLGTDMINYSINSPLASWFGEKVSNWYNRRKEQYEKEQNLLDGTTEFERQKELLRLQQEYNTAESAKNREFQLHMSNTAFQRQAEDLEKAGFNRALVLGNGGATTGTGSSASSGLGSAPQTTSASNQYKIAELTNLVSATNNLFNSAVSVYNQKSRNQTALNQSIINGIFGILSGNNRHTQVDHYYHYN